MLTDYFEPFTLLKSASCPDPCGGQLQQDVTELLLAPPWRMRWAKRASAAENRSSA